MYIKLCAYVQIHTYTQTHTYVYAYIYIHTHIFIPTYQAAALAAEKTRSGNKFDHCCFVSMRYNFSRVITMTILYCKFSYDLTFQNFDQSTKRISARVRQGFQNGSFAGTLVYKHIYIHIYIFIYVDS